MNPARLAEPGERFVIIHQDCRAEGIWKTGLAIEVVTYEDCIEAFPEGFPEDFPFPGMFVMLDGEEREIILPRSWPIALEGDYEPELIHKGQRIPLSMLSDDE